MSLEEFTMKRVRRQFTVEFKKNAVSLVVDEKRSVSEVAKSLNISSKTLSTWLRQSKEGKLEGRSPQTLMIKPCKWLPSWRKINVLKQRFYY